MGKQLGQALHQIEEERHRLSLILAFMSDGVIASDPEGRILLMNQRARKLLGEPEEAEGTALDVLLAPYDLIFSKAHETSKTIQINTNEGESFIRFIWSPLVSDAEQVVIGGIVILQDVTQQERLDRQRKEFVANVSHELRTPLATLKSYLEALEQGALTEPELGPKFLAVAHQETDRMSRLIHDLLQLSRMDADEAVLKRDRVDIGEVMEDVMDRFSFQIKKKKIHADLHADFAEEPIIIGDRDQIDQVMDNLLSNAIKYTPEDGKIEVTITTGPQNIEIRIADTGIGVPKEDLPRIFERFYRVDKARSRTMGGTGLGLAIASEIVRAHQGTIRVDSEWSVGTVVTVILPRAGEVS
jgi:two-component system sensor histidine kinase VicK